ncbi:hypothetical protein [Nocardia camponoti]|uniref:Uncharacterized protein n=1 Tax=Nocardia camponoti TaxID=1616106 RepID=A0A917QFQ1_9NOCA|nr:hypothetical protein [Nocardia camponoti]GGK46821.1 hypothetical protein GCM10011591_17700 [Nocardia camponoti]
MKKMPTKFLGPLVAVGTVSFGLIVIGACGVGQKDTYVAPPPIQAELAAAPAPIADVTSSTTVRLTIPPSPTWQVGPYVSPRKPFSLSSTETSESATPSEGAPEEPRPELAMETSAATTVVQPTPSKTPTVVAPVAPTATTTPAAPTTSDAPTPTAAPTTTAEPTTVAPTTEPTSTPETPTY